MRHPLLFSIISFLNTFFSLCQEPRLVLPIGHTDKINTALFSPDGKLVITASDDKTARIYEMSSGKELQVLVGHTGVINSAVFSFDGKLALTSSDDKTARIYEVSSGKELRVLRGHTNCVNFGVFSPDGKLALTASLDTTARIYEVSSGKELQVLSGYTAKLNSAVFSPDGKLALTSSEDSTARIYDVTSGKEIYVLGGHTDRVESAVFSPDGKLALTASWDNTARIYEVSSGKELQVLSGHTDGVSFVVFSPDGKLALTASRFGIAYIYEVSTGKEIQSFSRGYEMMSSAVFSPDGKLILTSSDSTAIIYDVSSGKEIQVLSGHSNIINSANFSPDGKLILTASWDHTARIYEVITGKELQVLSGHPNYLKNVMPPDCKFGLIVNNSTVGIYEISTEKVIKVLSGHSTNVTTAFFSSDEKLVITSAFFDDEARIYEVSSGKELQVLSGHSGGVNSAVFSPDGNLVLTSLFSDNTARIFEVSSGKELQVLKGHTSYINSVHFSFDGKLALTASEDNTSRIYDVSSGMEIQVLSGHTALVNSAVFSSDGKLALTASGDHTARIYEVITGNELQVLSGHTAELNSAVFSPDGKLALTTSYDNTARIYEVSTGKELRVLSDLTSRTQSAFFSADGKLVYATSAEGCIVYDVKSGKQLFTRLQLKNNDWLVYDEDYHFDGSEGAIDYLYLVCGLEVVDLAQVKDSLYVPGLVSKIMNKVPLMRDGKKIPALSDLNICNLTPVVEPQEPKKSGEYRYRIFPRNGGLGNTEVYINGNLTFTFPKDSLSKTRNHDKTESYELVLTDEQLKPFLISDTLKVENPIHVKSKIEKGSIYSRSAVEVIEYSESGPLPRFFGVFIGVDEYGNPEKKSGDGRYRNLDYAAKDANDLSNAIEASTGALFDKDQIHIFRLTGKNNTAPTKEAIQQTLDSIGKLANANDVLFIFFAGHGDVKKSADQKSEMLFLTERAALDNKMGFSVAELMEWCKPQNIRAQKRVFVFDACHSGQAVKDFNDLAYGRGEDEDTRILQLTKLKDKNGMMILAASAANEFAYEDPTLRQGVLTYHLLNAIKNNASALSPAQDSLLVIRDWFDEVIQEVTVYAQRNAQAQSPTSFGDGRFYIGKITTDLQANIDVKAQKMRIGKSVFVPIDAAIAWCPDLDRRINEKLSSASSSGRGEYVYSEREGYYAKGSYKIQKKKIMVSYALFKGDVMVSEQVVMIKPIPTSTDPALVADLIKESIEQELMKVVEVKVN
jgi:WD40 repeat protein